MNDYNQSIMWARDILAHPEVSMILDTETTGLGSIDEIVQIAIIDANGNTLLNTLVKPTQPIPPAATAIHRITDEMTATAPSWPEVWPSVFTQLYSAKDLVIYNARFDVRMIRQTNAIHNLPFDEPPCEISCAMLEYAVFFGDWNGYRNSYRWQPLQGGDHTALGDCKATLELIGRMANSDLQPEDEQEANHA